MAIESVEEELTPIEERVAAQVAEYWSWFEVGVFLLITVDMITTLYAASIYGPAAEVNPVMRWVLEQSLWMLVVVNIGAGTVVALVFHGLMGLFTATTGSYSRYFALALEIWLGLLVGVGLFVFANNLAVIVWGQSLL